jgi:ABC-type dipeptide/oligopeptide/nickel transport system permease component
MVAYIIRRLLLLPVSLFGVTFLVFVVLQFLTPIERVSLYVKEIPKNEYVIPSLIKRYGLDRPFYEQYWAWLVGRTDPQTGEWSGGILRGELGYSRANSQPVRELIAERFPATLEMALWSVVPIVFGGVWMGVLAALNHQRWLDQVIRIVSILGWACPSFLVGMILLMYFYADLGWFPPGRYDSWVNEVFYTPGQWRDFTHLLTVDALLNGRIDIFWNALRHLFSPVLTLTFVQCALLIQITRSAMLEAMGKDYITTAQAKGLSANTITRHHIVPNALIPVATIIGSTIVGLLNGTIITETIFSYPGVGQAAASAAIGLDVVTTCAFAIFFGTILVVANLLIDISYVLIDPRVRLD